MLILTRKAQQSIEIDQRITITVLGIEGGQVRLGIEAPRNMPIVRDDAVVRQPRRSGGRQ
jgi:carbon storage regulator